MSNKKNHHHAPDPASVENRPSLFSNTVLLSLAGLLGFLLAYAGWQAYRDNPSSRSTANTAPTITAASPAQLQTLNGLWVRREGGYLLDIKGAAKDGKLEAVYLNPNPIHIARAEADVINDKLRVFVEFEDVNYNGSTYDLRYDTASDQLLGEYFQASQQLRFQVLFDRAK